MGVRRDSPGVEHRVDRVGAGATLLATGLHAPARVAQEKAAGGEPCVTSRTPPVTGALRIAEGLAAPDEFPNSMTKG